MRRARMNLRDRLLTIDGSAGLVVGVTLLVTSGWLSGWYGLPRSLLVVLGLVNLAYASYALPLAMRSNRTTRQVAMLAIANISWSPVCLGLVLTDSGTATFFGQAHLIAEGIFVALLGIFEWRWRGHLASR